ncbi:MAG: hypothetical protein RL215_3321, partial [Planctomycetota bacterium]
MAPLGT